MRCKRSYGICIFYAFIEDIIIVCDSCGCEVEENMCPLDMDLLAVCYFSYKRHVPVLLGHN